MTYNCHLPPSMTYMLFTQLLKAVYPSMKFSVLLIHMNWSPSSKSLHLHDKHYRSTEMISAVVEVEGGCLIPFFSPICRFVLKIIEFTLKLLPFHISSRVVERSGGAASEKGVDR